MLMGELFCQQSRAKYSCVGLIQIQCSHNSQSGQGAESPLWPHLVCVWCWCQYANPNHQMQEVHNTTFQCLLTDITLDFVYSKLKFATSFKCKFLYHIRRNIHVTAQSIIRHNDKVGGKSLRIKIIFCKEYLHKLCGWTGILFTN